MKEAILTIYSTTEMHSVLFINLKILAFAVYTQCTCIEIIFIFNLGEPVCFEPMHPSNGKTDCESEPIGDTVYALGIRGIFYALGSVCHYSCNEGNFKNLGEIHKVFCFL